MLITVKDIAEQEKKLLAIDISTITYQKARRYFFLDYPIEIFVILISIWFLGIGGIYVLQTSYNNIIIKLGYFFTAISYILYILSYKKIRLFYLNRAYIGSIIVISMFIYFSTVISFSPANQDEIGVYIGLSTPWNILTILFTFIFFSLLFKRIIFPFCRLEKSRQDIIDAKNIDYNRHLFFTDLNIRASLFRQLKKGQQLGSIKSWELVVITAGSFFSPIITVSILHSNLNTPFSAIIMSIVSLLIAAVFLYSTIYDYQTYKAIKEIDKKINQTLIPVRATPPSFKRKL